MTDVARTRVQSVSRALDLLEVVAAGGGHLSISDMAASSGLPLPTIHRLARTLLDRGYLRQLPDRSYALGSRFIPLGELAGAVVGSSARPALAALADQLGESANLAVLDGDMVTYIGQVPSHRSMRMFTEVGRRVYPHCTGVGKALLAQLPDAQVRALLGRTGLPAHTPHTITDVEVLLEQIRVIRAQGFAVDEGEQEIGVRCLAVGLTTPTSWMAVSVSGPAPRMTPELVDRALPLLREACRALRDND